MNVGTKFGNFPQEAPQALVPPQAPAAFPQQPTAPIAFEGAEHGDTVHFSGSCCK